MVFSSTLFSACFALLGLGSACASDTSSLELWYRQPAADWHEALPVGNGSLGAMVFGGTTVETIQLNHDSLWSAGPEPQNRVGAHQHLPEIRRLLFAHEFKQAEDLIQRELMADYGGGRSHQTLGELRLELAAPAGAEPGEFRRSLDLERGVATTTFTLDGVRYRRDVLASFPDQVLIVHLTADKPGALSLGASLARSGALVEAAGADALRLAGAAQTEGNPPGVRFEAALVATTQGGVVSTEGAVLRVRSADSVTLVFACAADYQLRRPRVPRPTAPETVLAQARATLARADLVAAGACRSVLESVWARVCQFLDCYLTSS